MNLLQHSDCIDADLFFQSEMNFNSLKLQPI